MDATENGNNAWGSSYTQDNRYKENFSYDWNGNITSATRYDGTLTTAVKSDEFTYNYDANSNVLKWIDDARSACSYTYDVDDQSSGNYTYDVLGELKGDAAERITNIVWDAAGRVIKVEKDQSNNTNSCTSTEYADADLEFWYDASGQRLCKIVKPHKAAGAGLEDQDKWTYTWYRHDGGGNVMAVYDQTFGGTTGAYTVAYKLAEHDLYGGGRTGIRTDNDTWSQTLSASISGGTFNSQGWSGASSLTSTGDDFVRELGWKQYELVNHLGNVLVTVSDKRIPVYTSGPATQVAYYTPDVLSYSDYYAFGSQQPGRNGASQSYRYGFNGVESDPEMKGAGNSYNTDFRMYDPRVGRWLSVDPVTHPWESPYAGFANNPIYYSDPMGADPGNGDDAPLKKGDTYTDTNGQKHVVTVDETECVAEKGGSSNQSTLSRAVSKLFNFSNVNNSFNGAPTLPKTLPAPVSPTTVNPNPYNSPNNEPVFQGESPGLSDVSNLVSWAMYWFEMGKAFHQYEDDLESARNSYDPVRVHQRLLKYATEHSTGPVPSPSPQLQINTAANTNTLVLLNNQAILGSPEQALDIPEGDEDDDDPPVAIYIHYGNADKIAGIVSTGAIFANDKGKVYLTQSMLTPKEVEDYIFIGNPLKRGHGDFMVTFYVTASQQAMIMKDPTAIYEYIYMGGGALRLSNQILYAGPNILKK